MSEVHATPVGPGYWRGVLRADFEGAGRGREEGFALLRQLHSHDLGVPPSVCFGFAGWCRGRPTPLWSTIAEMLNVAVRDASGKGILSFARAILFPMAVEVRRESARNLVFAGPGYPHKGDFPADYRTYETEYERTLARIAHGAVTAFNDLSRGMALDRYERARAVWLAFLRTSLEATNEAQATDRSDWAGIDWEAVELFLAAGDPVFSPGRTSAHDGDPGRDERLRGRRGLQQGGIEGVRRSFRIEELPRMLPGSLVGPPHVIVRHALAEGFTVLDRPPPQRPGHAALLALFAPEAVEQRALSVLRAAWWLMASRAAETLAALDIEEIGIAWIQTRRGSYQGCAGLVRDGRTGFRKMASGGKLAQRLSLLANLAAGGRTPFARGRIPIDGQAPRRLPIRAAPAPQDEALAAALRDQTDFPLELHGYERCFCLVASEEGDGTTERAIRTAQDWLSGIPVSGTCAYGEKDGAQRLHISIDRASHSRSLERGGSKDDPGIVTETARYLLKSCVEAVAA